MHGIIRKKCLISPNSFELIREKKCRRFFTACETAALDQKEIKKSNDILSPKYNSREVEPLWYEKWENQNYFQPTKSEAESFVILLPPPNITGSLHLGHFYTATIQDVILRWKRMKKESVIWVPGIDHAGIATHAVVEKNLQQTLGVSRYDIGKEEFIKKVWEWKSDREKEIYKQLRNSGASLDWSRLKFTMDTVHSNLVTQSFVKLYNNGLIYRSKSLVNWSCALRSSISDIEIEWLDISKTTKINVPGYDKPVEFGNMYKIAYKTCEEGDEIVVHTTRPETLLGDVAVAVNPNDPRYMKYKNKMLWHPFRQEKIPVVEDDFVNPHFGSGAVKITPSHSFEDFKIAEKHKLRTIDVINEEGCMINVGQCEKLLGKKRGAYECSTRIPLCSRSGDVIEALMKIQWFLKCENLAADAIELVKSGKLKLVPKSYENVWYTYLQDCKDWNLSRQLWWGHQIPMYECTVGDRKIWVPASNFEEARRKAIEQLGVSGSDINIMRDSDVLDTWFSSGLLPLNTLSETIPTDKPPISLMITGHDILFFWIARMVFLSRSLTGKLPFNEVLLHGLMCDSKGKKMSKSLGNIIRPEDIIFGRSLEELNVDLEKNLQEGFMSSKDYQKALENQKKNFPQGIPECGADALRFSLCTYNMQNAFIHFDIKICHASRDFCNKIWQAMRYFNKITNDYKALGLEDPLKDFDFNQLNEEKLNSFDQWILSKMASLVNVVEDSMITNRFSVATKIIKLFVTRDFCGTYLECSKTFLSLNPLEYGKTILIFHWCIETYLKLLCPFMPFITEHLYQALPEWKNFKKSKSITTSEFPSWENWKKYHNAELENNMVEVQKILMALRGAMVLYSMLGKKPKVHLKCSEPLKKILFGEESGALARLGKVGEFIPVESHDGLNVIEKSISDTVVAYIEHDYDKNALLKLFGSTVEKEQNLRIQIKNFIATDLISGQKKMTASEKFKFNKKLTEFQENLEKIEEFKKVIENCTR